MNNGFKDLDYKWKNYSTLIISDKAATGKALISFAPHSGKEHVLWSWGVEDRKLKLCRGVSGLKIKLPFTSYTAKDPIRKYPDTENKELIAVKGDTIKKPFLACLHNSEYIVVITEKCKGRRKGRKESFWFPWDRWDTILRNHVNQERMIVEDFDVLLVGEYTDEEGKIKEAYMIGFGETRFWVSKDLISDNLPMLIKAPNYKECNLPERPAAAPAADDDDDDAPPKKRSRLDASKTAPITCPNCLYVMNFLLKKYPAILNALNGQAPEQPQPQWQQGGYPVAVNDQDASPKYGDEGFNGNQFN